MADNTARNPQCPQLGWSYWLSALLLAGHLGVTASPTFADQGNGIHITPREKWSTVFGGSTVNLHFDVAAQERFDGVLGWSLSAKGRTIETGESEVRVTAGRPTTTKISLRIPAVNDGVIFETRLSVSIMARDRGQAIASLVRPIVIFPRHPFFERSKWLERLSISLFDPEGQTAEVFESLEIPFTRVRHVGAMDKLEEGLLIVGEGVSFSRNRSVGETLTTLASRGVPVLCLAPKDGKLTLPMDGHDHFSSPNRVTFRHNDVITELDKRLDAVQWMSDGDVATGRIHLRPDHDRIAGEVSEAPGGWPWIELQFREKATLVYCGFEIIKRWDDGPTPRFLLARLFEHLGNHSQDTIHNQITGRRP